MKNSSIVSQKTNVV